MILLIEGAIPSPFTVNAWERTFFVVFKGDLRSHDVNDGDRPPVSSYREVGEVGFYGVEIVARRRYVAIGDDVNADYGRRRYYRCGGGGYFVSRRERCLMEC